MDKVTLNGLSIFLTHRCNMACPHCLRGTPENTDISPDTIDALLEQTEMIDTLSLTGGEPLLAVETIKYIAYGLAKRGIMLFRLQIVTNGFEYNEQFVEAVKMYRQIIDISRREGCEDDTYDPIDEKWRILIGVSWDKYHETPDICEANFERYKEALEGVADVLKIRHGNAPTWLIVSLQNRLYTSSPSSFLKRLVSNRLLCTVVNRAMYCPASITSTPRPSISFLMASFRASISAAASFARASHSFRASILLTISILDIVLSSFNFGVIQELW